ncbi:MAG TPA: response regulator transcription factor [Acidimicrobiales bacterium]|nr:response regulator transcription factor [Acidimicrobiales bacterium]
MTRDAHPTVLIVDDEFDIRLLVRTILEAADVGVEVVGEAADGFDAMAVFETLDPPEIPDVVILDNRMPGREGIEVAQQMLEREPRQTIVLFSAFVTPELEARAEAIGVRACVGKSDFAQLPDLVRRLAS